ncbi:MAG: AAA family ATPase [Streptosporangiales bacterium]|nr:AAA family ATPase [Streptosporangiales bacterium]
MFDDTVHACRLGWVFGAGGSPDTHDERLHDPSLMLGFCVSLTYVSTMEAARRAERLVGRAAEQAALDRALGRLRGREGAGGDFRFLEIVGEPGMGKSRLLAELRTRAADRGHLAVAGRATELAGAVPYAPMVDALDDHLATMGPEEAGRLGTDPLDLLISVFPSLEETIGRTGDPGPGVERYRIHRAVGRLLEYLAVPRGLVVVLDDLHWADEASVELLIHLLRRPPRAPVLLGIAHRPRQLHPNLAAAPRPEGVGQRLELGPLSREEAGELLGSDVSQARLDALYELSQGNPFYLEELAKTPLRPVTGDGIDVEELPRPVGAAFRAELDALSPSRRLVAYAAATLDEPFEPELVAEVAGLDTESTLQGLHELTVRDLLRPADDEKRLRYRHPLVRHAVFHSAGQAWLLGAHARAAAALARSRAPAVRRAPHVMRAAPVGDEGAILLLIEAAEQAMPRSPAAAARWLDAAVRKLPQQATDRRVDLLGRLGHALLLAGRLHDGRAAFQEVLRLLPPGEPARRVEAAASCALVEQLLGRYQEARDLLLVELRRLPADRVREAGVLKLELAYCALLGGDFPVDRSLVEDVLGVVRGSDDPSLSAGATAVLTMTAYVAGDAAEALTWRERAAALIDELPDGELARRLGAAAWLGWAEMFLDRNEDALRHLDRGLSLARSTRQAHLLTYLVVGKACALHLVGRLDEAAGCADDGVESAELSGSDELRSMAYTVQGLVALARGDEGLALRAGERAVRASGATQDWWSAAAGCTLAAARLANDDPSGCVAEALRSCGGPDLPSLDPLNKPFFAQSLVLAELALGRVDGAGRWVDLMERSGAAQLPSRTGHVHVGRACVLLVSGEAGAAVERARAAASAFAAAGHRIGVASAHLVAGMGLAQRGDDDPAAAELEQAVALFAECGARARHDQAVHELRKLGRHVPPGPRQSVADSAFPQLTRRQAEIAALVAQGHTNREIAQRLALSRRTVEIHVASIRARLGVSSRAALAAAVTRMAGERQGQGQGQGQGQPSQSR